MSLQLEGFRCRLEREVKVGILDPERRQSGELKSLLGHYTKLPSLDEQRERG